VSARILIGLVAALAVAGCVEEDSRFPVVVSVTTDDGKPLAGLAVTVGNVAAGKTGSDGKLSLHVVGKEGARVPVAVATPAGYRPATPASAVVLRRLNDIDNGGRRQLPVEHALQFAPLQRRYAVLVRAGVAGLPVAVFGSQKAVTNDKGVALFLYEGTPGDELQVKLITDGRPELRPQNPMQSFVLAPRSEAYLVKEHFAAPVKKEHHHRPVHVGPTRL
jgi:hypothetical protein